MRVDPEALPYQSPEWFDCILAMGNCKDVSRMYEFPDGRFLVLPLVRHGVLPMEFSPPAGWGMGGLLSTGGLYAEDITAVFEDLRRRPVARISIRPNPNQGALWEAGRPDWVTAVPRYAHVIDLSDGFDSVLNEKMGRKIRKALRKAERCSDITVEWDDTGRLIPEFYQLLMQSFDRWSARQNEPLWLTRWRGQRRDSLRKFEVIADKLGSMCRVYLARRDGKAAAASVTLQASNVNDSRGAMDHELVGQSGANYLLQKVAIEEACKAGCRYYHLGESGRAPGLALFKERFGAVGHEYNEYHVERLPITKFHAQLRNVVKKMIGFKDVPTPVGPQNPSTAGRRHSVAMSPLHHAASRQVYR